MTENERLTEEIETLRLQAALLGAKRELRFQQSLDSTVTHATAKGELKNLLDAFTGWHKRHDNPFASLVLFSDGSGYLQNVKYKRLKSFDACWGDNLVEYLNQ